MSNPSNVPLPSNPTPPSDGQPAPNPYAQPAPAPQRPYAPYQGNTASAAPAYGQAAQQQPAPTPTPTPTPTQPYQSSQQPYGGQPAGGQRYSQPANPYAAPNPYMQTAAAPGFTDEPPLDRPYYGCSIDKAFIRFWKKYVVFSGRASRGEFWWVILCNVIIGVVLGILIALIHSTTNVDLGFLTLLYDLAVIIPTLSLSVRRLHDTDRPGWWMAIIYGAIFLGGILELVGGASFLIGGAGALFGGGSGYGAAAAGGGIALVIGALLNLAAGILYIVFMALPSKPEGARFDARPTPTPAPMPGAPMAPVPGAQSPYAPYGAPAPTPMANAPAASSAPALFTPNVPPMPSASSAPAYGVPAPQTPQEPAPQYPSADETPFDADATVLGQYNPANPNGLAAGPGETSATGNADGDGQPAQTPWQGR
ncbi:DUF805 domain-containing protein [Bifidobacterium platyrrhinorum]|nr:DUF805 domain-containing protein [Bifidobacterium platyrrhinorum]